MFITDKTQLKQYETGTRTWQGIPSVACTAKGRIFACWYSGKNTETFGNYSLLVKSDDGENFSQPIAVAYMGEESRAYDSCLWIDPDGRLWYFWSVLPQKRVEFAVCENPDATELEWSEIRTLGGDIMMNKPTVLKSGDWLFPVAVWKKGIFPAEWGQSERETGAYAVASRDKGQTFEIRGKVDAENRNFDEHILLEKQNGDIEMFIRTFAGISAAVSKDGGYTFGKAEHLVSGPSSRFEIRRLSSGNIIMIYHRGTLSRNNLCAMLSEDDGVTFPHVLMLDERNEVSYPDLWECNGKIYIIYDRERGAQYTPGKDYSGYAKEILLACITERDIIEGKTVSPDSFLKRIVNKIPSAKK